MEMVQIGATEFATAYEQSGSDPVPGGNPVHALYAITLAPDEGFPKGMTYPSIVIRVERGSIRVVSPGGQATVSVGTAIGITRSDGEVTLVPGTTRLDEGAEAILGVGNAVYSTNEALDVVAGSQGATLIVSVVISAVDIILEHCWICPTIG